MRSRFTEKMLRPLLICAITVMSVLSLTSCGEQEKSTLDIYRDEMTAFYNELSEINTGINAIDPSSETATVVLMEQLDRLNAAFTRMSRIDVPAEFAVMGNMPQEAADYMDKAVNSYHDAYDGTFDAEAEQLAGEYYERANIRARYMLAILHGDTEDFEQESSTPALSSQEPGSERLPAPSPSVRSDTHA